MKIVHRVRALRRDSVVGHAVLGAITFIPLLLTAPDRVAADTRQYLYVDPSSFVSRALTLWDPHVHLGTVEHSNIGLVFPMGTFFAGTNFLQVPAWVAQRLWLASILFAAGAGVLYLARTIEWRRPGALVAALAYALTPYTLQYAPRTSVLLLPFAALPWMIGATCRGLRTGGWRHPALLALLVMAASGANVSAAALVALGPALWVVFAVGSHETSTRDALVFVAKSIVLALAACVLWITALALEAGYGLNLLAYTETLPQVATTSTAAEVLRGLGYWLFYGTEAHRPNISAASDYLVSTPVIVVSYLLPGVALVSAFIIRWRYRTFCIALIVTGVVVSIGVYPYAAPSLLGRAFKGLADVSSVGLVFRSATRAVPLVVLGLALLIGAAVDAVWNRRVAAGFVAAGIVAALVLIDLPALFSGGFVDPSFSRPATLPRYWTRAAAALDRANHDTRVLEIPGNQFAAYRWGNTYDTSILATLLQRPSVAREQIPFGSPSTADLLSALDRRIQEGVFEPEVLAPMARLMSAGDIVLRSDLAYERYSAPRPRALWRQLVDPPPGLAAPVGFGTPVENRPDALIPLIDALTLGLSASLPDPPPVAIFHVRGVPPIVHVTSAQRPTLIDGDGEGVVDAATVGAVTGDNVVLYGAWLSKHPKALARAEAAGADIVVTDTNRRRERRWRSTQFTTGLTDRVGHSQPRTGQGEAELPLFPGTGDNTRTVTQPVGATVDASVYGSPITFDPDQRAFAAFDGDPSTAWQVGTILDPVGQHLTVRPTHPITTDHLDVLQPQGGFRTRFVSEVLLRFDNGTPRRVQLDATSHVSPGQRISFPRRTFSKLDIEIAQTVNTPDITTRGGSPTGFAEITIPGLHPDELVRLPRDLTRATASHSLAHRLLYVLTRLRANPATGRGDEEATLERVFDVPASRSFSLSATARVSALAPDDAIDRLVGLADATAGGVTVTSSGRLPGAVDQRARAAIDGNPATHWTGTFFEQAGSWINVDLPAPHTIDHLDLAVIADGRHSVPTQITIASGTESRVVDVPPVTDRTQADAVTQTPVRFAPITGSSFRVTVSMVREVDSPDAFSQLPLPQPVAIAELGLPGVVAPVPPATLPSSCRNDLLTIDGTPVALRISGTTSDALGRNALRVEACNGPFVLSAGRHVVRTARGRDVGFDVDRLVLASERGGAALRLTSAGVPEAPPAAPAPHVKVVESSATSTRLRVSKSSVPFWLVQGESHSGGWAAHVVGGKSLSDPALVNGYANGWYVPAGASREIVITWEPEHTLRIALVLAALAIALCLLLVWRGRRWRAAGASDAAGAEHATLRDIRDGESSAAPRDLRAIVGLPVGVGVVTLLVVGPAAALATAALVAAALRWRRGRLVLAVASLALVAAGFIGIVRIQHQERRPVGFAWTKGEEREHRVVLTGLMLLAADPAIAALRSRAARERRKQNADL